MSSLLGSTFCDKNCVSVGSQSVQNSRKAVLKLQYEPRVDILQHGYEYAQLNNACWLPTETSFLPQNVEPRFIGRMEWRLQAGGQELPTTTVEEEEYGRVGDEQGVGGVSADDDEYGDGKEGWETYHDDDGTPYYHQPATGLTQWELPEQCAPHQQAASSVVPNDGVRG